MNTLHRHPEIFWHDCQPEQLVLDLFIGGSYIKAGTSSHQQITEELLTLLYRLFARTQAIMVKPLSHGFSGTRVLQIQPFYATQGAGRQVVVKFGDICIIQQEHENYIRYIQSFIGDGRNSAVFDLQQTAHLAGIVYSFLGADMQRIQEFGTFYQQAGLPQIKRVLDNLFRRTCRIWYANAQPLCPLNLTKEYQRLFSYTTEQVKYNVAENLPSIQLKNTLAFTSLKNTSTRHFTNPFHVLETAHPFIRPTYVATTHGDLNQRNILIDQANASWLIDFQCSGPGHILRDVAMLDAVLRFQLLSSRHATLDERLTMEEALCTTMHFSQIAKLKGKYSTENPVLAKTYGAIVHLRTLAAWIVEKNPADDMSEYYIALLYITLNMLRYSTLEIVQREHALLSASLLVDLLCPFAAMDCALVRKGEPEE